MTLWERWKALGNTVQAIVAFVVLLLTAVVTWKTAFPAKPEAKTPPQVSMVLPSYEGCRELTQSQSNRILDMVASGRITAQQGADLAHSLACKTYRASTAPVVQAKANGANLMEDSLTRLLTSRRQEVRVQTVAAIRSDFADVQMERLTRLVGEAQLEPGAGMEVPTTGAGPGAVQASATLADDYWVHALRVGVSTVRNPEVRVVGDSTPGVLR